jgi:hypothetical protein
MFSLTGAIAKTLLSMIGSGATILLIEIVGLKEIYDGRQPAVSRVARRREQHLESPGSGVHPQERLAPL